MLTWLFECDNEEMSSCLNEHWKCKDRRLRFWIRRQRWQVKPKDSRSELESRHWKIKTRQSSGRSMMEVRALVLELQVGCILALFRRLQSSYFYSELSVSWSRWVGRVKTTKSRRVSITITNMNPTFTAEEFSLWTITTPRDRKTVYLINLREPTKINCEKWNKTFLDGLLILRANARTRGQTIWRWQVQRVCTRPTTVMNSKNKNKRTNFSITIKFWHPLKQIKDSRSCTFGQCSILLNKVHLNFI